MLEAQAEVRSAPGETLHPGVEAIFRQLNVWDEISSAGFHRHRGIWKGADGRRTFAPYGRTDERPWLGFQADRRTLHDILQRAAMKAGATVIRPMSPRAIVRAGDHVVGIDLGSSQICARWVLDATGRRAWLARALGLVAERQGPLLRARFGWSTTEDPGLEGQPQFDRRGDGWDWRAPLGDGRTAWVKLRVTSRQAAAGTGAFQGLDLTWRRHRACAGPGYFLLGDAAALLDPSSSNGVLRALMSAIFAIHLIRGVLRREISEPDADAAYMAWIGKLFDSCAAELRELYTWPTPSFAKYSGSESACL